MIVASYSAGLFFLVKVYNESNKFSNLFGSLRANSLSLSLISVYVVVINTFFFHKLLFFCIPVSISFHKIDLSFLCFTLYSLINLQCPRDSYHYMVKQIGEENGENHLRL